MSIMDSDNRPLLVRWVMVVLLTVVSAGQLAHSIFGDDGSSSANADKPTRVEVRQIYSGGRIKVSHKNKVAYEAIRVPGENEPLYEESKQRNIELVEGKALRLVFESQPRDLEGRLWAYAFVDDVFVNETLVREGLAHVRLTTSTRRFADRLLQAQQEARDEGAGLWAHTTASSESQYPADPKYGNFHRPSCEETAKIKPQRRVTLSSKDEAFDAGYAPCVLCNP